MFNRIKAIILQDIYISRKSLEVMVDIVFFPAMSIIAFGFFTIFLSQAGNPLGAKYLLLGMMMWEIIRIGQYSITVGALWNVWARNLSNLFITPLSFNEYLIAQVLAAIIKSVFVFLLISGITLYLFHFNIYALGIINVITFIINLLLFSWSTGIIILGLIFRFGTRVQALAWGIIFLFQPLMATFFPVSVLPPFLQKIAYMLPATYVFEAARAAISNTQVNWYMAGIAFAENILYFIVAFWIFHKLFKKSRQTGQFARNEG